MTDRLKPTSKAFRQRQHVWRHNGLRGTVRMMEVNLQAIANASSANSLAKTLARQMLTSAAGLAEAMKERIDP